jgi:hypothetical protein
MNTKQEESLAKIPTKLHNTFIKAWSGKSRTYAIRAMCYACIGYNKQEVENCTSLACPLYAYRSRKKALKVITME